jgi:5-methylcytosine-specific restriction endonuclease McrA
MSKDPRDSRAYRARRLEILSRDQWTCFYCMQPATTVDHVIPIKAGGDPLAYENLVACCSSCNSRKGSRNQGSFLGNTFTPPVFDWNDMINCRCRLHAVEASPLITR